MRILHLDTGQEMRGGQWQVLQLYRGLRDRGYSVMLLARGDLLDRAVAEKLDAALFGWKRFLQERRAADVIHAHDARSHTAAILQPRRAKVVVSRRVAFPVRQGFLSRWKYSRPAHYIAISQFVADRLRDAGVKSERISVVYDGVPALYAGGRVTKGLVVAPASADPMKGTDLIREAGRLAGAAILFSSNLSEDLPHAEIFVYGSRSEGLGSAVLLAMAHGLPVIASRVGGLIEAVEDNVNGLLVDNRPDEFAHALQRLQTDPALRARLGENGRARARKQFALDSMVEGTIRVYEEASR